MNKHSKYTELQRRTRQLKRRKKHRKGKAQATKLPPATVHMVAAP
jgi:hypothetical protein